MSRPGPPQTAMRDSGIGWAGQIPYAWDVGKVCLVARLESGHTPSRQHPEYWVESECTIPWFSLADVWQLRDGRQDYLGDTTEKVSARGLANSSARLLPAGTVVLSRTASVGFAGIMPRPMATTQDFANWICGPRICPEYLLHCFRAMQGEFERFRMGSTHQTIYMPDIRRLSIPLPERSDQERIVAFLAARVPAIDTLIAKKERLIELLQEKRQALITRAVTKGLDPNVPMKDSGIEWLGEIPAHWPVVRVSYFAEVQNGMTPSRDRIDYWEDGTTPWISSGQVNDYVVTTAREFITDRAIRETRIRTVPAGSVLVGLVGQGKTRGLSARMEIAGCINQNVAAITPNAFMDRRFLHLVLMHAYPSIRELGRGGQQDAMNCDIIRSLRVPMPPLPEQLRLIDHVDGHHATLDAVLRRVETHVDLLREYRQALISAAVTGSIEIPTEDAA